MPRRRIDPALRDQARELRSDPTPTEEILWRRLRSNQLGHPFRRQVVLGTAIVDFCCRSKKLVVEVDGESHEDQEADRLRDARLQAIGYRVIRFWDSDVAGRTDEVVAEIEHHLEQFPRGAAGRSTGETEQVPPSKRSAGGRWASEARSEGEME